jgi:solute carrier family 25 phosphate transporter 23/24/25/41
MICHLASQCSFTLQFFNSNPVVQSFIGNTSGNPIVHFVSGGLAGITAATATYPLDLVRTRLAAQVIVLFFCFLLEYDD